MNTFFSNLNKFKFSQYFVMEIDGGFFNFVQKYRKDVLNLRAIDEVSLSLLVLYPLPGNVPLIFYVANECGIGVLVVQEEGKVVNEPPSLVYKDGNFSSNVTVSPFGEKLKSKEPKNSGGNVTLSERKGWCP